MSEWKEYKEIQREEKKFSFRSVNASEWQREMTRRIREFPSQAELIDHVMQRIRDLF